MRLFTVEEARAELRSLLPSIGQMVTAARRAEELERRIAAAARAASGNGRTKEPIPAADASGPRELEQLRSTLERAIRAIAAAGAEVKDVRRGLIDFPAERRGEVVYLCYEYGEPDIEFWHPVDTGYAGRRPMSEF
ncbi:MAG: DUF2203 domain-containing protein [Chloroflexota bacterium]|nr:DUF2203 domain-containing protein [Dehalococcoidia bacterium]MDW8047076.1 DUF2203 domain-containing protein [Chloroflexota bacterium]